MVIFHKAVKVVSNKDADTMKPDQDLNVIDNTNMKIADISKEEAINSSSIMRKDQVNSNSQKQVGIVGNPPLRKTLAGRAMTRH